MRSSSLIDSSVSEPNPALDQQAAFQQARIARAMADCRQAWELAYKERRDQQGARCFCLQYGARAYRSRMPMPTTAADLPIFMACFTQAIVLQVFTDKEQSRLMQAAKLVREFLPPSADPLDDTLYTWEAAQLAPAPKRQPKSQRAVQPQPSQPATLDTLTAAADPAIDSENSTVNSATNSGCPILSRSQRKGGIAQLSTQPAIPSALSPLENLTAVLASILLTDPELPREPRKNRNETSPHVRYIGSPKAHIGSSIGTL